MNGRLIVLLLAMIFLLYSCESKYSKYNADWIVTKAEYEREDVYHLITLFNFSINIQQNTARPVKIDLTDEFTLSKDVPIKLSSENGKDFLEIMDHPNLAGKYEIECLDETCCTISIQNDKVYLELIYNSEIPYSVKRDCS